MAKGGETVVAQGKKITSSVFKEIQKAKIAQAEIAANDLEGAYIAADVVDMSTGEVLIDANSELTTTALASCWKRASKSSKSSSRSATTWAR